MLNRWFRGVGEEHGELRGAVVEIGNTAAAVQPPQVLEGGLPVANELSEHTNIHIQITTKTETLGEGEDTNLEMWYSLVEPKCWIQLGVFVSRDTIQV